MKNKYLKCSKISEAEYRHVLKLFCDDLTAVQIAESTGVSGRTVNRLLMDLRSRIASHCEASSPLSGEVEVEESYFGPRRVRGKKGRGAGRKIVVFGMLKRRSKVYTQIVPNASRIALKQVIEERIEPQSTVYSDGWKAYDGLVDWGYQKHYRVNHGAGEFARGRNHINGIESFWGAAKVRLAAKRGLRPEYFNLHLKECEFRYNMRHKNMYLELLKILREKA